MAIDPSAVWDFAMEVIGAARPDRGRTLATVTRVDPDGTTWVTTGDGGEAPASSVAAGVSVGDTVTLEWDGSAMGIRGNVSNPSPPGSVVRRAVERTRSVADAAQRVADAVNQHFFADGHGIHVTEATQEEWDESHAGPNVLINSIGQLFRDGLNNLLTLTTEGNARALTVWDGLGNTTSHVRAIIGETITLGPIGSVRMILSASDMALVNEGNDEIFSIDSGSTGSATVVVEAVLVTWSTTASVDTTTRTVSDAGTAAGTTTVTATINGSEYALGSTYATATVTAGTGVSVALTSAGVTYVQGLMVETVEGEDGPVTTTYPCELSVEYQHTVTDKATMSLTGSQTIGGEGAIIYMVNDKWSSTRNTSTLIRARNAATGREVQFGVATDGRGRGVWDSYKRSWLIYRDANDKTVIGGPNFSVDASGNVRLGGTAYPTNLLVNNGWSKILRSSWSSSNQKDAFLTTENSVTGQRVAFGIAHTGYNRGIWDAAKSRWIVVKNQSDEVSYYGLHSNFEIDAAAILSGSTSISGGGITTGTKSISRSGWYPFAIAGWNANTRYALPARLYLSARGNGTGTISWGIYNPGSSAQTPTVTAYVLWARGD